MPLAGPVLLGSEVACSNRAVLAAYRVATVVVADADTEIPHHAGVSYLHTGAGKTLSQLQRGLDFINRGLSADTSVRRLLSLRFAFCAPSYVPFLAAGAVF